MPETRQEVGALGRVDGIHDPGSRRRHAREKRRLLGEHGRIGLVHEQRQAAGGRSLAEDLRIFRSQLHPLPAVGLEIPPAVPVDHLGLLGVGQLFERP